MTVVPKVCTSVDTFKISEVRFNTLFNAFLVPVSKYELKKIKMY
jgi:hypothetical protein